MIEKALDVYKNIYIYVWYCATGARTQTFGGNCSATQAQMNLATQINSDVEQIKIFNKMFIYANIERQAAPSNYETIEVDLKLPIANAMNGANVKMKNVKHHKVP